MDSCAFCGICIIIITHDHMSTNDKFWFSARATLFMKRIEKTKHKQETTWKKKLLFFGHTNILNSVLADDRELIIYLPNSVSDEMVHGKCASIYIADGRANEEVSARVPIIRFHLFPANRVRMARLNCIKFIRYDSDWSLRCQFRFGL